MTDVERKAVGGSRVSNGGRIVVGLDASEEAKEALRWAARYARFVGASMDVVHAWHPAEEHVWLQSMPPPAGPTDVAREALAKVVAEEVGSDIDVKTAVVEGHAAQVLNQAAQGAILLVVGNRGFGGFDGLLIGSTSQHCAAHAPCSVVIVRQATSS
jgi:nucleotide-binding universal stress UspA family protein